MDSHGVRGVLIGVFLSDYKAGRRTWWKRKAKAKASLGTGVGAESERRAGQASWSFVWLLTVRFR